MVFAWPEPPNAKSAGQPAGARCGVQEALALGGIEKHQRTGGETDLPANCNRHRGSICMSGARAFAFRERAFAGAQKGDACGHPGGDAARLADRRAGLDQDGRAGRVKGRDVLGGRRACPAGPAAKDGWAGLAPLKSVKFRMVITGTASAKDIADEMAGVELPAHTAAYTSINRTETSSATTPQLPSSLS